jgi:hypothetical protein
MSRAEVVTMRLTCEQCEKHFEVPEDKLPGQGRFRFTCPECGSRNIVVLPGREEPGQDPPERGSEDSAGEPGLGAEPEMFPPGAEVAFVRVSDETWWERVENYLLSTGFYLSTAETRNEAVHKLRLNSYQWVILEEGEEHAALLKEIARWPGQVRREVNVILLGQKGPSFDPRQAFLQGVNAYLALSDTDNAEQYLDQARSEFEQLKEPWNMVRQEG